MNNEFKILYLNSILSPTTEKIHFKLDEPLCLNTPEDQGLNDALKPHLLEIWHDKNEHIWFKVEDSKDVFAIEQYPEFLEQIIKYLREELS